MKAPIFKSTSTNKNDFDLKNFSGKYIVLYFYPKDDTPGCTIETNYFNKLLPQFKKINCEIFGISKDSLESHKKFKKKYGIKIDYLELRNTKNLRLTNKIKNAKIFIAYSINKVRLIDNF